MKAQLNNDNNIVEANNAFDDIETVRVDENIFKYLAIPKPVILTIGLIYLLDVIAVSFCFQTK